jgi:hypothetical protein
VSLKSEKRDYKEGKKFKIPHHLLENLMELRGERSLIENKNQNHKKGEKESLFGKIDKKGENGQRHSKKCQ